MIIILQTFREKSTIVKIKRRSKSALSGCENNLPTSMVPVSPWVGSHKLFKLLHIGDALDILFLLEPFLDGWSIEIQSIASEIFRLFCVILCRFL